MSAARNIEPDYPVSGSIVTAPPAGKVIVHSHVRPARRQGTRGSRFWFQDPDPDRLVVCECGWAPEVGTHFRLPRL